MRDDHTPRYVEFLLLLRSKVGEHLRRDHKTRALVTATGFQNQESGAYLLERRLAKAVALNV